MASAEEPDFTRFRITTNQGSLVVYDAEEAWDGREEPASQLAYWNDFASEQFYFFDRLLFTPDDVLQSVAAMQRDLHIDPAPILAEKPELSPLPDPGGAGEWRLATEEAVLAVMSGQQLGAREGRVSGVADPVACAGCDPELRAPTGPIPSPIRGASSDMLLVIGKQAINCNCGGGPCPTIIVPCADDGNPCTADYRPCGSGSPCNHYPRSGAACPDDGEFCTDDVCAAGQCTHPNLPNGTLCPEDVPPNECTMDVCQGGHCEHWKEPLDGSGCTADGENCTTDICRDGSCEHEENGCSGNPCNSAAGCVADNDPCTLSPQCEMGICVEAKKCADGDPCTTDVCDRETGACEFLDFEDGIPPEMLCGTYGCVISIDGLPNYAIPLNDDDDNGDGRPDYEDAGTVPSENDIVCVSLTSTGCPLRSGPSCGSPHCPYDHWHSLLIPSAVAIYANVGRGIRSCSCPDA